MTTIRSAVFALAVCALASASGCGENQPRERPQPSLTVERTPGRPIAPRASGPARAPHAERQADKAAPRGVTARFTRVQGDAYSGWVRAPMSADHWRPADTDIAAMETRIPDAFSAAMERGELPAGLDVGSYERQYSGYVKGDTRVIEVHFFCARSRHLARQDLRVAGGGACFLHSAYDTRAKHFRYWRKNPE